ncbi:hypothetical protein QZH41_004992 [Actinostola sp. cb2023]|nr:hypothetical protein QZH41_004992 [Actinostola sp. cb2023]
MSEEPVAIALYDYNAQQKEELSIKKNEKLIIIDDSQTWWKVRNEQSLSGYVPSNYVGRKDSIRSKFKKKFGGKGGNKKSHSDSNGFDNEPNQYCTPESVLVPTHKAICEVVAKFNYKPRNNDELELNKGDRIFVLEKEHDGWWKGRCGYKQGWFPSNYAEESEQPEEKLSFKVVALYPFSSSNEEELSFQKDETLDILRQPDGDPDWWEAKKSDGSIGLVPKNYVKTLSQDARSNVDNTVSNQFESAKKLPLSPVDDSQAFQRVIKPSHKALPFANEKWFWGTISRENGERLLGVHGDDGDFLIRESETVVG